MNSQSSKSTGSEVLALQVTDYKCDLVLVI